MNYEANVLTVSALNFYIKNIFDSDQNLLNVFVEGEISNFKNHYSSGHLYFSLKDQNSVIKCVMFRSSASRLKFTPENDMKVILRGRVAVYERDGQYQIYCEDIMPLGAGALAIAFEQLKAKLQNEGLFNIDRKRELPKSISRIAVITSEIGAAIKDIISVAGRRNPFVELIICPVLVQGAGAANSMVKMLERIYSSDGIDAIIIGRGGGSLEDLWCFNDETLVRKIYESPIPVISAVGHETDFTLCDFVADMRAPTPSAAAEMAVPDILGVISEVSLFKSRLHELVLSKINLQYERLDRVLQSRAFLERESVFLPKVEQLKSVINRFFGAAKLSYMNSANKAELLLKKLESLNPISVMFRGFSLVYNENGIVNDVEQIKIDSDINVKFTNGTAKCKVLDIERE